MTLRYGRNGFLPTGATRRGRRKFELAAALFFWLFFAPAPGLTAQSQPEPPSPVSPAAISSEVGDDAELTLLEAIRSDRPERLFELLKDAPAGISQDRRTTLQAFARYRLGEFEAAERLAATLDSGSSDTLFLKALLRSSQGQFAEAEALLAPIVANPDLGLLSFEAGLLHSNVLQQLDRHGEAASDVDRILPTAPFGRPELRSIRSLLQAAPEKPYRKVALSDDHTIPLLADGSLPARTILPLEENQEGKLVLFDTGSSLTMYKADLTEQDQNRARALGLSYESNTDFQYAWRPVTEIGGWRLEGIPVGLVNRNSEQAVHLNYDAVFSLPLMRRFFVVFDFPGRKVQLLAERPAEPEGERIPFRYVADQILLAASVNGKPALLLLDTGFGLPSMKFDISWAQILAQSPQPPVAPPSATGPKEAEPKETEPKGKQQSGGKDSQSAPERPPADPLPAVETQITSLKIGNVEMTDLSVTLDPLHRRLNQNPLAARIDGILAAPLLQEYVVSIDFLRNELYLARKAPRNN